MLQEKCLDVVYIPAINSVRCKYYAKLTEYTMSVCQSLEYLLENLWFAINQVNNVGEPLNRSTEKCAEKKNFYPP